MIRRLLGQTPDGPARDPGRLVTSVAGPDRAAEPPDPPAHGGADAVPLSEADLDRLAVRVAEHLLRGSMAATLPRIVADVSERLVRLEIERIRREARGKG